MNRVDVIVLQDRLREMEKTANQAAECHARETRRADAAEKRIRELEAELAEVRKDRDQFESELMHLENGESM